MSTITLTASMRSNLASLKSIQKQMNTTQERLSTGKKVNSAIDNASSFYQARALTNRASDLDALLDSMGQGIQTIKAATEGLEAITSFVEQMKSVAESAYSLDAEADGYEASVAKYAAQFDAIQKEISDLAKDASYQGINLLKSGKLTVTFNETRTNKFEVAGKDVVESMGITGAAASWEKGTGADASVADIAKAIDASITEISKAIDFLRDYSTELGNNFSIIETRQSFTESLIDVLETGADNLVLADMNEETANYLALQTRQQLAINSLSLASQSAQSVLKLF